MRFTVVIPALNEAARVGAAIASAFEAGAASVVVADGGSVDSTRDVARKAGAEVVGSAAGRAVQMNAGARAAGGDVLVFLHADTRLTPAAGRALRQAYAQATTHATVFRLRFDTASPLLRFYEWSTRVPYTRIAFGDRALGVRRDVFEALGGFPEIPVFEDLEMVQKLKTHGGLRFLSEAVVTSARRFEKNGPFRQQWLNLRLWARYLAGTPPAALARAYGYGDERGA